MNAVFLAFLIRTQSAIVCFYKEGKVTYFSAQWEFDSVQKLWNILYKEQEWKDAPSGNPLYHLHCIKIHLMQ